MSLLDGLFLQDTMTVNNDHRSADEGEGPPIEAGFLHQVDASDSDLGLLIMAAPFAELSGKRIAVKVVTPFVGAPGGLTVTTQFGITIQGDDGVFGTAAVITGGQTLGNYREWICDDFGRWIMVVGASGGGSGGLLSFEENGNPIGEPRPTLNFSDGTNTTVELLDSEGSDRMDVFIHSTGGGGGAIADPAAGFAWVANAASLDVSLGHNFAATNTLTGNSTLTLLNGIDGCNGTILVKQDATGSRTLAFTVAGRTVYRDLGVPDLNPFPTANAVTYYQYYYVTVAGTALVIINKIPIAP